MLHAQRTPRAGHQRRASNPATTQRTNSHRDRPPELRLWKRAISSILRSDDRPEYPVATPPAATACYNKTPRDTLAHVSCGAGRHYG